ncbi:hypothetical protein FB451DRAFT_1395667 [Mycena latifolia]|nr:hypothetical protein FB451DRAFT_1395667 [Mycena latifolia]
MPRTSETTYEMVVGESRPRLDPHTFSTWFDRAYAHDVSDATGAFGRGYRSPVFHAHNIELPLLLLQGSADPMVPPNQAEDISKVTGERNGTVEYVVFEGESHVWRKAENIAKALEVEIGFYERVLNLGVV